MSDEKPVTVYRERLDVGAGVRYDAVRDPHREQVEGRWLPAAAFDALVSERDALRASLARAEDVLSRVLSQAAFLPSEHRIDFLKVLLTKVMGKVTAYFAGRSRT